MGRKISIGNKKIIEPINITYEHYRKEHYRKLKDGRIIHFNFFAILILLSLSSQIKDNSLI